MSKRIECIPEKKPDIANLNTEKQQSVFLKRRYTLIMKRFRKLLEDFNIGLNGRLF